MSRFSALTFGSTGLDIIADSNRNVEQKCNVFYEYRYTKEVASKSSWRELKLGVASHGEQGCVKGVLHLVALA